MSIILRILTAICILLLVACDGMEPENSKVESGTATVWLDSDATTNPGFSFSAGNVIIDGSSPGADIALGIQRDNTGEIVGLFMRASSSDGEFARIGSFDNPSSAVAYYQDLSTVPEPPYVKVGLGLSANQIWAVRTRHDTFAKVYIKSVEFLADGSGEVVFDWTYQENGNRSFE